MATPWTLSRLERAVANFSGQLQCAICLSAYDSPVSLPCHHCFCEECIHRALELKTLCPICKTPATKRQLRYDTTVQELLKATEILCAVPTTATAADEGGRKAREKVTDVGRAKVAGAQVAGAQVAGAQVAGTLEQRTSPHPRKRNLKTKRSTVMDVWMSEGHAPSGKTKKDKQSTAMATAGRRGSPRSLLVQEIHSPMSPALFEMPSMATTRVIGPANGDAMDETLPRRPSSDTDATEDKVQSNDSIWKKNGVAVDVVAAETQLETVEQEPQVATGRRSSTDAITILDANQVKSKQCRRRQARANQVSTEDVKAAQRMLQTPIQRTRRQSVADGIKAAITETATSQTLSEVAVATGRIADTNRASRTSSLAVDSQTTPPLPNVESNVFRVEDVVEVTERQWVGINKQGGAARITKVYGDGFYAVKFVMGGKDNRVPGSFIRRPTEELISDVTPSCSVKKRQRRRVSDKMITPDPLATKATGSIDSMKIKAKRKRKLSNMVFLCSGFKEQRMQQIDEWANLLGAGVVHDWSNDVTHLIVKCVSKDGVEKDDPSMEDSDSTSLPHSHRNVKREGFSDPKSGRWVKTRSLKYLKALVGGRWIVSDEWLRACAEHGGYVKEVNYEADGHWKGRRIHEAVKRSRLTREKLLQLSSPDVDRSTVGTMLFADFCFHIIGEFLPPMPPVTELKFLICIGGGKLVALVSDETHMREHRARKLVIVSDKINPVALRQQTRQLKAQPEMKAMSSAIIVNYLWVLNSISEANLRELP